MYGGVRGRGSDPASYSIVGCSAVVVAASTGGYGSETELDVMLGIASF